jgi:DNA-binding transcriptional ArsR family regulator
MTNEDLLRTLAAGLEAAAATFRTAANKASADAQPDINAQGVALRSRTARASAVERARLMHPTLGKRQAQIIEELTAAEPEGTDTGQISRSLQYDQPNVYLTLAALRRHGLVEKDESQHPHRYRLAEGLR